MLVLCHFIFCLSQFKNKNLINLLISYFLVIIFDVIYHTCKHQRLKQNNVSFTKITEFNLTLIKNLQVISIKFEKGEHTVKIKSCIVCIFLVSTSFNSQLICNGIFKENSNISCSQREKDVRVKMSGKILEGLFLQINILNQVLAFTTPILYFIRSLSFYLLTIFLGYYNRT